MGNVVNLFKQYMKPVDKAKAHAVLSASGSERWLSCPGSIKLSEGLPNIDGEWSIAGTNAHTLLQFILENYTQWKKLLARPEAEAFKKFISYSEEQLNSVLLAATYVWDQQDDMQRRTGVKPTLLIEQKVELPGVGFGTSDVILFQPFGVLHVMDFKNGRAIVEPEENKQGLYYGVAAAELYGWDFREVWITIMQPNARHAKGPIRTWKTTIDRLEAAGEEFRLGAKRTKMKNAPLVMNDKYCWFCLARSKCPEQMKLKSKNIMNRFERGPNGQSEEGGEEVRQKESHGKAKSFCDSF